MLSTPARRVTCRCISRALQSRSWTNFIAGRRDPFVVELGSNDGIMLRHFHQRGIRHLGIEPSVNVADVARSAGIQTISAFFNRKLADDIVAAHGQADAILAANVMCHIPDLGGVADGIRRLLEAGRRLHVRGPVSRRYDRQDLLRSDLRRARVRSFSATSVAAGLRRCMVLISSTSRPASHARRFHAVHAGAEGQPAGFAARRRATGKEDVQGLDKAETYHRFRRIARTRARLMQTLEDASKKKRVVGYGATSKSTTVTNYCGITPAHVEFISDTTPIKQGKLSPGAHIPVKPYSEFVRAYPDYALLFAWNHAAEIREKERRSSPQAGAGSSMSPK